MNRRSFIKTSLAASALPLFNIGCQATRPRICGKGRRLRVALVGCGGRGVNIAMTDMVKEEIVAFADPNPWRIEAAFARLRQLDPTADTSKIKVFRDYRDLFDQAADEIDAAIITTQNSQHALAALMAMRKGIHVFVEKPLALTVEEVKVLHAAAKRYGVVTQVGHHGHSTAGIRLAAEYMAAGAFGEVRDVYCWCDRVNSRLSRPPKATPPAGMDWDAWCGGSPICDWYDADGLFPALTWHDWHNWIDYGNGSIGNMGSHIIDTPVFMLGLDKTPPVSVEAKEVVWGAQGAWPLRSRVDLTFPARGKMSPVTLHWYDGVKNGVSLDAAHLEGFGLIQNHADQYLPPEVEEMEAKYCTKPGVNFGRLGTMIVTDRGVVTFGGWGAPPRFWPDKLRKEMPKPPQLFERIKTSHQAEFYAAIREGRKASTDFDYGAPLAEMILLANAAQRAGCKRLDWNGLQFTNDAQANTYLTKSYRKGWNVA